MQRKPIKPRPTAPVDIDEYKSLRIAALEEQKRREAEKSKRSGWENCT